MACIIYCRAYKEDGLSIINLKDAIKAFMSKWMLIAVQLGKKIFNNFLNKYWWMQNQWLMEIEYQIWSSYSL